MKTHKRNTWIHNIYETRTKLVLFIVIGTIIFCFRSRVDADSGFLSVYSDPRGISIYLDGEFIGITPIQNYSYKPGEYSISIFSSDTLEQKYWQFASGSIGSRLSALWYLSKAGAATKRVKISSNQHSEIFFSLPKINRAPTKIKIATACCLGTGFSVAFLIGFLIANFISAN